MPRRRHAEAMRRLAVLVSILLPAVALAAPPAPARPLGVVDARPLGAPAAARVEAEEALRRRPDLGRLVDPELAAALTGVVDPARVPPEVGPACASATDEALLAWLSFAPLDDVRVEVARILGRQLACADGAGDRGVALAAARRLTALGSDGGVDPAVWARYPAVDATVDVLRQPLAITAGAPGAVLRVDLVPTGPTP